MYYGIYTYVGRLIPALRRHHYSWGFHVMVEKEKTFTCSSSLPPTYQYLPVYMYLLGSDVLYEEEEEEEEEEEKEEEDDDDDDDDDDDEIEEKKR